MFYKDLKLYKNKKLFKFMKILIFLLALSMCSTFNKIVIFYPYDFNNQTQLYKKLALKEIIVTIYERNEKVINKLINSYDVIRQKQKTFIYFKYAAAIILYIQFLDECPNKITQGPFLSINNRMLAIISNIKRLYEKNLQIRKIIKESSKYETLKNKNEIFKYVIAEIVFNVLFVNLQNINRIYITNLLIKCKFESKNLDVPSTTEKETQYEFYTLQDMEIFKEKILTLNKNAQVKFKIFYNSNLFFTENLYNESYLKKNIKKFIFLFDDLLNSNEVQKIRKIVLDKEIILDLSIHHSFFERFVISHYTMEHEDYYKICSFLNDKIYLLEKLANVLHHKYKFMLIYMLQPCNFITTTLEMTRNLFKNKNEQFMCSANFNVLVNEKIYYIYRI